MTDRFDEAKRALEGVPTNDVWVEAERRASDGTVAPLTPVAVRGGRHRGRWLAGAAAVAVLAVGTVAVLANDNDPVSTGPGDHDLVCGITTTVRPVEPGVSDAFAEREGDPPESVIHGDFFYGDGVDPPTFVFEIASPADASVVIAEAQSDSIEIDRGEADLVFNDSISRLTWEPDGTEPCETFSITVSGAPSDDLDFSLLTLANDVVLTGPEGPDSEETSIYQASGACRLGVTGEPLGLPANVSPAETFVEGSVGTLVEGSLNDTQTYAAQVPGQVVTDLVGERVEDVQLERGTAQVWFQPDAVQLRWFTGSQEVCESFTVTVGGGTEDENRHAAVDLGERVLLPSELPDDPTHPTPGDDPLTGTEWQLERTTIDGVPTEGPGSVFTFTGDRVAWTDGCNRMSANYAYTDGTLALEEAVTTYALCEPNPTSDAINAVMTRGPVAATFEAEFLVLRAGGGELTLRPLVRDGGPIGSEEGGEDPEAGTVATSIAPTTSTVPITTTLVP